MTGDLTKCIPAGPFPYFYIALPVYAKPLIDRLPAMFYNFSAYQALD
jgi:hypothetical protein